MVADLVEERPEHVFLKFFFKKVLHTASCTAFGVTEPRPVDTPARIVVNRRSSKAAARGLVWRLRLAPRLHHKLVTKLVKHTRYPEIRNPRPVDLVYRSTKMQEWIYRLCSSESEALHPYPMLTGQLITRHIFCFVGLGNM